MEPSDLEKQLGDLEEKVDRLRALYEQYFMGIERLEPLTPRKEVDRRIVQLRKEQMRNTALRFRFNTICQRFNTMQQHWGRITREIENGTYKRDVARAAARFGLDDALTAVGRKRAKALAKVLEAQGHGEGGQPRGGERREREERKLSDEYEAVSPADLLTDEDDAPTPPPLRPLPPPVSYDPSKFAPPAADPAALEQLGFRSSGQHPAGQHPAGQHPAGQHPAGQHAAGQHPAGQHPAGQHPAGRQPGGQHPAAGPSAGSGAAASPPAGAAAARPARAPEPAPSAPAAEAPKKAAGGLRLGGGGPRRADPDAARRRLEELSQALGGDGAPAAPAPAPSRPRFDPGDVIASAVPASVPPPASPARPAAAPAVRPEATPTPPPSAPSAARPLGLRPPSARTSAPSLEAEAAAARAPAAPAPSPSAPAQPTAAERAEAKREAVADRAAKREDLGEPRVREIYKEFVEAKRRANESTASITYDKLADSLRKQVDKLKKDHAGRTVDFAVVTKDGKTLIKPIIK